ncbi:type I restriction enzyme HsdR N-terminal domain-containing protein [Erythrobacter sp. LQ02-29]|uniref:type I restriction endonuclease n=1 Tax=Erythrobacter sp. LQ02-29 TaxID=2920384 RepID=UPI001F4DCD7E|nr:type I restriction endonuclease [Erythrobacter sp. LQ02-29]MCP9222119.1 type I restriction enzyme HsdR N-terminal domain-containing protein [Erythrobacter sp. LQ02-29]
MEFEARIEALADKVKQHASILETEEAAKTALVMPFLQALGYDVFNPAEVVPEFTCDVGTKKGEKVDYAICLDGDVRMLVECKPANQDLSLRHASQLYRYFSVTDAKFAILTNGAHFKIFSDLDSSNRMDEKPFFEFDLRSLKKTDVKNLAKFQRAGFDIDQIVETAANLQMEGAVTKAIETEMREPSSEFVKLIAARVTDRRLTSGIRSAVARHIPNAFNAIIRDRFNERISSAMSDADEIEPASSSEIETTPDELEGFRIVRSIGSELVEPSRIVIRDSKSYCAVLLDDNNRKPVVRLRFNSSTTRHLGTFDKDKEEALNPIDAVHDIYKYKNLILDRIRVMLAE